MGIAQRLQGQEGNPAKRQHTSNLLLSTDGPALDASPASSLGFIPLQAADPSSALRRAGTILSGGADPEIASSKARVENAVAVARHGEQQQHNAALEEQAQTNSLISVLERIDDDNTRNAVGRAAVVGNPVLRRAFKELDINTLQFGRDSTITIPVEVKKKQFKHPLDPTQSLEAGSYDVTFVLRNGKIVREKEFKLRAERELPSVGVEFQRVLEELHGPTIKRKDLNKEQIKVINAEVEKRESRARIRERDISESQKLNEEFTARRAGTTRHPEFAGFEMDEIERRALRLSVDAQETAASTREAKQVWVQLEKDFPHAVDFIRRQRAGEAAPEFGKPERPQTADEIRAKLVGAGNRPISQAIQPSSVTEHTPITGAVAAISSGDIQTNKEIESLEKAFPDEAKFIIERLHGKPLEQVKVEIPKLRAELENKKKTPPKKAGRFNPQTGKVE